ncbi:MAG TPA: tetratricopeptide repeat protein [Tepidisphaeraceae bacterium]|jgi:tetratricopeptide (TPR) repeat protein
MLRTTTATWLAIVSIASVACADAPADDPLVTRARTLEANAYETKSDADFMSAAIALEEAVARFPDDLKLRRSAGFLWLEKLKYADRAYPHLEIAYQATPSEPGWGEMLASAAEQTGRQSRQIQVLKEVVDRHPEDPWARLKLGRALMDAGRPDEARPHYEKAYSVSPTDPWVSNHYAEFLIKQSNVAKARDVAQQNVRNHPDSAAARATLGDVYRFDWNLTAAAAAYAEAKAIDPTLPNADDGLRKVTLARSPTFNTVFYQFKDTDNFNQSGSFNSLTVPVANRLFLTGTFNARFFEDDDNALGRRTRYEEAIGLEYRANHWLSLQGSVTAFQTEKADEEVGFTLGATIKPTNRFYAYGFVHVNDPVSDSFVTVADGLTQDLVGAGAGYQLSNRWSAVVITSLAGYSDGNERRFLNADTSYLLWAKPQLYARAQYEIIDYEFNTQRYSSPDAYQIFRPTIEAEPQLTSWLSLRARLEVPYVVDDSRWGTGITIGPVVRVRDRLEFNAAYMRFDIPGDVSRYNGEGFRLQLIYRF